MGQDGTGRDGAGSGTGRVGDGMARDGTGREGARRSVVLAAAGRPWPAVKVANPVRSGGGRTGPQRHSLSLHHAIGGLVLQREIPRRSAQTGMLPQTG